MAGMMGKPPGAGAPPGAAPGAPPGGPMPPGPGGGPMMAPAKKEGNIQGAKADIQVCIKKLTMALGTFQPTGSVTPLLLVWCSLPLGSCVSM